LFFHCFVTIWLSFTVYALQIYNFFRKNKKKRQKNCKIAFTAKGIMHKYQWYGMLFTAVVRLCSSKYRRTFAA